MNQDRELTDEVWYKNVDEDSIYTHVHKLSAHYSTEPRSDRTLTLEEWWELRKQGKV